MVHNRAKLYLEDIVHYVVPFCCSSSALRDKWSCFLKKFVSCDYSHLVEKLGAARRGSRTGRGSGCRSQMKWPNTRLRSLMNDLYVAALMVSDDVLLRRDGGIACWSVERLTSVFVMGAIKIVSASQAKVAASKRVAE
jgi:hypothetical protein